VSLAAKLERHQIIGLAPESKKVHTVSQKIEILRGQKITLKALSVDHTPGLAEAVQDGELWKRWYTKVPSPSEMEKAVEERISWYASHGSQLFTVFDSAGTTVGMTGYQALDLGNRRAQIGYTWYRQSAQNTAVNADCKLTLMGHAFEQLDCLSVFFTTNSFNRESRRALESLGAHLDGILRGHQILDNGIVRDTCVYSVLRHEWPAVKNHLHYKIDLKSGKDKA
jgi:amino-acid acetyltransferase